MFDKIKGAFKALAETIQKKSLTEEALKSNLQEFEMQLIANDVASPVAKKITQGLQEQLVGKKLTRLTDPREIIKANLKEEISKILHQNNGDLIKKIERRKEKNSTRVKKGKRIKPFKILFLGPNGAGKTTSIAKLAWKLKGKNITSLLVASDTFRAGAQEQLKKHAQDLELPIVEGEYKQDPASVGYDAVKHAKSKRIPIVLIDTAGRLAGDVNLIEEMKKIDRVISPELKIFVASALSGNELANQARKFQDGVGFEGSILTKVDADVRGGAAVTLAYASNAPIFFVGVGQKYADLEKFDADWFVQKITAW